MNANFRTIRSTLFVIAVLATLISRVPHQVNAAPSAQAEGIAQVPVQPNQVDPVSTRPTRAIDPRNTATAAAATQRSWTATPVPPTQTPVPPSATPNPTQTPVPPSATPNPTQTPVPPSATPNPTQTPVPPSSTPTPNSTGTALANFATEVAAKETVAAGNASTATALAAVQQTQAASNAAGTAATAQAVATGTAKAVERKRQKREREADDEAAQAGATMTPTPKATPNVARGSAPAKPGTGGGNWLGWLLVLGVLVVGLRVGIWLSERNR